MAVNKKIKLKVTWAHRKSYKAYETLKRKQTISLKNFFKKLIMKQINKNKMQF